MTRLSCHRTMNNFTPRAQQVLALARKEADRFNHNYVGTEHLLLGLIKLGQGVAVNVLQKMGLDLETVRMEVEKQVGSGPETKDRKSTRLNSSHRCISYAVFCLKKKKIIELERLVIATW